MTSYDEIARKLATALDEEPYESDFSLGAIISIDLCEAIREQFNSKEIELLKLAHDLQEGIAARAEGEVAIRCLWGRVKGSGTGNVAVDRPLDRLLMCALSDNTEFTLFYADFILYLSKSVGVNPKEIDRIMRKNIKEYNSI